MRALFLVMLLCTLAWAQKGAGLAISIDSTVIVKDISKVVQADTKIPAHPDSCLWAAKMVRWQEPARIVRPQEDILLPSYIGTKDTIEVIAWRKIGAKRDTMFYRIIRPLNPPIDSANAIKLRLLYQFGDYTVRGRDSTGALK